MGNIIGFVGKMRVGKTTAAEYLIKQGYKSINFKDSLIEEIVERFPELLKLVAKENNCSVNELFKIKPPIIRCLLQNFGTDVRRKDYEDYWVNKWLNKAVRIKNIVIDDVRFLNEAHAVRLYNGIIIKIERGGYMGDGHKSETEMDKIRADYVIKNDSSKQDLINKIKNLPIFNKY